MSELLSEIVRDGLYKIGGPQGEKEKPYEVRRRGLTKLFLGGLAIVGTYFLSAEMIDRNNGIECTDATYTEQAQQGDTAWKIAGNQAPKFNATIDEYMDQLFKDNHGLHDGLQIGEEIVLRESCSR